MGGKCSDTSEVIQVIDSEGVTPVRYSNEHHLIALDLVLVKPYYNIWKTLGSNSIIYVAKDMTMVPI
jgi:ABC-type polysaccharide transport system permease subunit